MILTPGRPHHAAAPGCRQLVWFVDHWDPAMPPPAGLREIQLPYGRFLYVLPARPHARGARRLHLRARRAVRGRGPAPVGATIAGARRSASASSSGGRRQIAGSIGRRRVSPRRLVDPPAVRPQPGRGRAASPTTPVCRSPARRRRSGRSCSAARSRSPAPIRPGPRPSASPPRSATAWLARRLAGLWTGRRALGAPPRRARRAGGTAWSGARCRAWRCRSPRSS